MTTVRDRIRALVAICIVTALPSSGSAGRPPRELLVSVNAASPLVMEAVLNAMPWDALIDLFKVNGRTVFIGNEEYAEPMDIRAFSPDERQTKSLLDQAGLFFDGQTLTILITDEEMSPLEKDRLESLLMNELAELGVQTQVIYETTGRVEDLFSTYRGHSSDGPPVVWFRTTDRGWAYGR